MLQIKFLTWLSKRLRRATYIGPLCLALMLFTPLSSCSNIRTLNSFKGKANLVYVDPIPNKVGIYSRSQLRAFFTHQDKATAKYILRFHYSCDENLRLKDPKGFAAQNELTIYYSWQLIDNKTGKTVVQDTDYNKAYYTLLPSAYATENNKEAALEITLKFICENISFKILANL